METKRQNLGTRFTPEEESLATVPEALKCAVCLQVLWKPATTPCGHTFCGECISEWRDSRGANANCPACRTRIPNNFTCPSVLALEDMIDLIPAVCPLASCDGDAPQSCQRLTLGGLRRHRNHVCPLVVVPCEHAQNRVKLVTSQNELGSAAMQFARCTFQGPRGDEATRQHMTICPFRATPCPKCAEPVVLSALDPTVEPRVEHVEKHICYQVEQPSFPFPLRCSTHRLTATTCFLFSFCVRSS